MTPIQQIKEGVLNKDWEYIIEAYFNLTGEKILLEDEVKPDNSPELEVYKYNYICNYCGHFFGSDKERKACPNCKKRKNALVLEEDLNESNESWDDFDDEDEDDEEHDFIAPTKSAKGGKPSKYGRTEKLGKNHPNTWKDDGSIAIEDKEIDKLLYNPTVKKVRREKTGYSNVKCTDCSRPKKIATALLKEDKSYICDNCVRKRAER